MAEALIAEPVSLWTPASPQTVGARSAASSGSLVQGTALPVVEPGQLWVVELAGDEPGLAPLEYRALTTSNVVIYDRGLGSIVAQHLPLGGYAEPAGSSRGAFDRAWGRCLGFVRDGWSVVRLVPPPLRANRLHVIWRLAEQLRASNVPGRLPVSMLIHLGGQVYERFDSELDELDTIVDLHCSKQTQSMTVMFGSLSSGERLRIRVASTNGLAG
jgi:hypothetical protein